ncbi:MAG: Calcium-gated potassium channel mthK [Aeromicrobium sp.]|nr:Calcium-gated potassium channel mthK [Aeromicrobium sp.]
MSAPPSDTEVWTGHVIVCGLHDEGLRVVEQLDLAGVPVVVVDDVPDQRLLPALAGLHVPLIAGDSRRHETLETAGLGGAQALVCVESDDLHTLATALLVRELRPSVRVVVQLRNASVGRALEDIGVSVLDVASLSAPAVVEACLRTGVQRLELGDVQLVVTETLCSTSGSLRDVYGDLAPIAVIPAGGAQVIIAPGRDHRIAQGDSAVMVGTAHDVLAADLTPRTRSLATPHVFMGARAPRTGAQSRASLVRDLVSGMDRRLKRALLALALLISTSIVVLMIGYKEPDGTRMSPLDALYFTVETIGTVGYGDFYFRDQHPWLRVWAILLMLVGATLATVFFALLTNALITRTIQQTLGRRKVDGLSDHVIVVGLGSIGVAVVDGLRAGGVDVVVVEADENNRFLAQLATARVPLVVADATLPETLAAVRLGEARAVAVMTSDDLANIETGLAVRDLLAERWAHVPVVLRLFDRRLAQTVESSFDFRYVRSPAALAAPWFVGAALGLDVLSTFYVGDQPLVVASVGVEPRSGLDGLAMVDLSARVRVVALRRADGSTEHPPRRNTRFAAGDLAFVIGPYAEMLLLLREYAPAAIR